MPADAAAGAAAAGVAAGALNATVVSSAAGVSTAETLGQLLQLKWVGIARQPYKSLEQLAHARHTLASARTPAPVHYMQSLCAQ
jgi:hypothetical protein